MVVKLVALLMLELEVGRFTRRVISPSMSMKYDRKISCEVGHLVTALARSSQLRGSSTWHSGKWIGSLNPTDPDCHILMTNESPHSLSSIYA
jgi:hypothetical protein